MLCVLDEHNRIVLVRCHVLFDNLNRVVGGAIIHNDDLVRYGCPLHRCNDGVQRPSDVEFLVQAGHKERHLGIVSLGNADSRDTCRYPVVR